MFKKNEDACGRSDAVSCELEPSQIGLNRPLGIDWHPTGAAVEPEDLDELAETVAKRLREVVRNISTSTDLEVDMLWPGRTIGFEAFEEPSPTRVWHQDGDGF